MAISTYNRPTKEFDFSNINTENQLNKFTQNYRQDQAQEAQDQKQREATYLKQAQVDPVFNMSSYWQKQQGDKINEFQNFLAQKYHDAKERNRPDIQDLIEIQKHKAALIGWQSEVQANQKKYAQAQKLVDSDPYGIKYDKGHFQKKVDSWVAGENGGKLDDDLLLPPRIGDRKGYYETKNWKGTKQTTVTDHAGVRHTVEVPMTDDEAKAQTKYDLFDPKNAGLYRTVTEDFSKLPNEEKKKYLEQSKDDPAQAIVNWNWDTAGKYAVKKQVKDAPAPKGRASGGSVSGSINYENPSDEMTVNIGKFKNDATGKTERVPAKVDVWGGYSLPGSITGVATARNYYDMETGQKENVEPGNDIIIKYPEIKYLPIGMNGEIAGKHTGYRDDNGKLRDGYKIKAILITRDEAGASKGLELTPELKDKLITKNPKLASEINKIPLEVIPKGKETPGKVSTTKSYTVGSKKYTHDDLLKAGYSESQIQKALKEGKLK